MLSRWDPFAELSRLEDEMRRAFTYEDAKSGATKLAFRPLVDITETKNAIELRAELPGVRAENVHLELEKNVLTLRGERKEEKKTDADGYHRYERRFGAFARSFVLPETVDGAAIDAELRDGVLTVRLAKKQAEQPRKIEVRTGAEPREPVGKA